MPLKRRKFLTLASLTGLSVGALHRQTLSQTLSFQDHPDSPTEPTDAKPLLRWIAVGDVGTGEQSQYKVAQAMGRYRQTHPFDSVLLVGDNIYAGGEIDKIKQVFEEPYQDLLRQGVKFYAVLGNHDILSNQGEDQIRYAGFNMQGRYYTFSQGSVQFFALDTNSGHHQTEQLAWLEAALAESQADWKIVLGHHPIYASGLHSIRKHLLVQLGPLLGQHQPRTSLTDQLPPLFDKYNVQLYINGHEHHYERTLPIAGTTYLTCGIGGAQLRPTGKSSWTAFSSSQFGFAVGEVFSDQLVIKGIGVNGQPFDRGVVRRQTAAPVKA
ncbi:MAG: metallophosphoesterase [Acaryochloris sp. RU_4_1]|nr:metallophosphoesterase [Acaryochloris sp. RU_4_1]NJN38584.1 metallophosphoesterase [Acaryochloridaceae cyanobacterium CSU_3_4]